MLTRVKEMVDALNSRPNAKQGFAAKELYKVGQEYGLTCYEVMTTFLGKSKAISRGRYLPVVPSEDVIAANLANVKRRGRKPGVKVVAKKAVTSEKGSNPSKNTTKVQSSKKTETPVEDPGVCYIATPEEIAE